MSHSVTEIQSWLCHWLSGKLGFTIAEIDPARPFAEYGIDSLAAVELAQELQDWLQQPITLDATLAWDYPTPTALATYVAEAVAEAQPTVLAANRDIPGQPHAEIEPHFAQPHSAQPIAIVGMGLRFPGGVDTPDRFWQLLTSQTDPVKEIPAERWDIDAYFDPTPATPGKISTRRAALLDAVADFDAHFFGVSSQLATEMDPQQRLLLEVCWEALEDAAIAPDQLAGSQTGVYIGISTNDYAWLAAQSNQSSAYRGLGNAHAIAANHISYLLNLQGPSLAIDTACSSSLVALHQACRSLRSGEIDQALVGGVNLALTPELFVTFSNARMLSPTGRCATFDAAADGYVRGEGAALVVLKRLKDAEQAGDRILAIIRGSAVNQDGRSNGLTAPSGSAQQAVIRAALRDAGVTPDQISYVEAHGTGTPLGDPIEVNALSAVLNEGRRDDQPCWIGAVKSQIGHLESAAGMAGLIKTILCLQHRHLPANLHLHTVNPHIKLAGTPLQLLHSQQPWQISNDTIGNDATRLAGVSSFGFGGTNAHIVLAEAPKATPQTANQRPTHLLTLSAKSEAALCALAQRHADFLQSHPQTQLADFCHTANSGRAHLDHRLALVASTIEEMHGALAAIRTPLSSQPAYRQLSSRSAPPIVFLFTGQGAQTLEMGRQLYETQPTFRRTFDRCDQIAAPLLGESLVNLLYPSPTAEPSQLATRNSQLTSTAYAQPALFALEYALYELWRSWGVTPDLVMGHSLGEYVAACVAGAFTIEEGMRLVVARGRLMQALPGNGSMAAVFASQAEIAQTLALFVDSVTIAAINAARNLVLAGEAEALQQLCATLRTGGIESQSLQVSHAFHSPQVEPMLDNLAEVLRQIAIQPLRIPLVSNLTAQILPVGTLLDAEYWQRHSRQPVQFMAGLQQALAADFNLFLELGPSGVLISFGKELAADATWLSSLQRKNQNWQTILRSLAQLHLHGVAIDWAGVDRDIACQRIAIPTYPFQRQRYWVADGASLSETTYASKPTNNGKLKEIHKLPPITAINGDTGIHTDISTTSPTHTLYQKVKTTMHEMQTSNPSLPQTQRQQSILAALQSMTAQLLHLPLQAVNSHIPLVELGADSLILLEAIRQIESDYQVRLSVRSFFEELSTLDALATYLAQQNQPTSPINAAQESRVAECSTGASEMAVNVSAPTPVNRINPGSPSAPATSHSLESMIGLFERQIEAMRQLAHEQIDLLRTVAPQPVAAQSVAAQSMTLQSPATPAVNYAPNGNGTHTNGKSNSLDKPAMPETLANKVHNGNGSSHENGSQLNGKNGWHSSATVIATSQIAPKGIKRVPLSEAQQQLWFLSQMSDEASIAYNESVSLWLRGELQSEPLRNAIQSLVDRHEALRTTIDGEDNCQLIHPTLTLTMPMVDLSSQAGTQKSRVDGWLEAEGRQPLDLAKGPLLRVYLLKLAATEYVLVLSAHHIIIDGVSLTVLMHELGELYSANCRGQRASLLPATQFSEQIEWQQARRDTPELANDEAYWLQSLQGDLPVLELPWDRPRPPVQSYRGAIEPIRFDRELTQSLHQFSRQAGATLFMTLLASYFTLLHRLSGQQDIIVGIPTAGREMPDAEELVGYCTHLLPIRNQLSGNPSFMQLLHSIRGTLLEAYQHAEYPFARLINKRNVSRDLSLSPILSTTFNLNRQVATPRFHALEVTIGPRPTSFVDHELSVNVFDDGEELLVDFEYNSDLFDATTVQRIASHFETLVRAIVDDAQQPALALPLLTASQRQQLLVDWNATDSPFDATLGFHQLFEAQVAKSPDAIAVASGSPLTYAQLNAMANGIAHQLQAHGVGSEVLVALLCERGSDFLAAMIAIFKAGGAYLPLDVRAPAARQGQMLAQSKTPLLLITHDFADAAQEALAEMPAGQQPLVLHIEDLKASSQSSENLPVPAAEDVGARLAYVIYTSGSTGLPKGAMVEQRGMVNHLYAKIKDLQLTTADSVAQTAPQSFDISVWQFLSTLIIGGQIYIFPDEIAGDPRQLLQQTAQQSITILEVVPSLLRMMLDEAEQISPDLTKLRWMIPTGEALPPNLAKRWMTRFPAIPMINAYGPTECSDDVTHYPIFAPPSERVVNMSIGRPVVNMRMYILDALRQPVPIGVAGELYVGGIGVGRGYIHDPERTALAFVADPFSHDPRAKLYKTGDKARYLPDGNIEYLGRLDFQVKIRGFRIELGEIEAILEQHPAVYQSVVIDRLDQSGNKRLIAYVVLNETSEERISSALRQYMINHLPDYMVPSAFVVLDAIPLTPNGKTDRKALPAPESIDSGQQSELVAARNPTEAELVNIWAEVLHLQPDQLSIHHDFFELGGHSLLATQAASRIRQSFAIDLPLRSYFNEPTIAGLATLIDATRWSLQSNQPAALATSALTNNDEREIGELL